MINVSRLSDDDFAYGGFRHAPDEKECTVDEVLASENAFYRSFFQKYRCVTADMKKALLDNWLEAIQTGHTFTSVPFVSVTNKRLEYLPVSIIIAFNGSNGMCAGNTREEALVQGLAEVYERQAQKKIITERLTPPDIPDAYLSQSPGLYRLKRQIEAEGRYRVIVKDCSLGKGYPVLCTVIINTAKGTFGVKFASHPSFEIALERTFTEAFQGKTLEIFTSFNAIGSKAQLEQRDNLVNTMKTGQGFYPWELMAEKPTYAFTPFKDMSGLTNREMLTIMTEPLLAEGYDILIRDYSYTGFPTYFILVPGISEIYEADKYKIKESYTAQKIAGALRFSDTDFKERLARYIQFKKFSLIENSVNWILQRPFIKPITGSVWDTDVLLLVLLFDLGRYTEAVVQANRLVNLAALSGMPEEAAYYQGIALYITLLNECGAEEASRTIRKLRDTDTARRITDTFTPGGAVSHTLPRFNCYDCANCEAASICGYPETGSVLKRMKDRYKASGLTQEALLNSWN
jgi:ribosomal protein S12 methylthiotransferase accessory factor